MSVSTESRVSDSVSTTISLDELAFFSAALFLIGSIISLYIAYKNIARSDPSVDSVIQTVP